MEETDNSPIERERRTGSPNRAMPHEPGGRDMKTLHLFLGLVLVMTCVVDGVVLAQEEAAVIYPTAVLPFQERGTDVREYGDKLSDLLFATLVVREHIYLVDRSTSIRY